MLSGRLPASGDPVATPLLLFTLLLLSLSDDLLLLAQGDADAVRHPRGIRDSRGRLIPVGRGRVDVSPGV